MLGAQKAIVWLLRLLVWLLRLLLLCEKAVATTIAAATATAVAVAAVAAAASPMAIAVAAAAATVWLPFVCAARGRAFFAAAAITTGTVAVAAADGSFMASVGLDNAQPGVKQLVPCEFVLANEVVKFAPLVGGREQ